MSEQVHYPDEQARDQRGESWTVFHAAIAPLKREEKMRAQRREQRQEFWSYCWGLVLALVLTLVPFAMVYWAVLPRFSLLIVIGVFALAQIIVHIRFFLRIGVRQKREDLQLILFSALLLIIMVAGTIWIMFNLADRMSMPMHP
ncbi:MAG: cytochrome C oxidase subunit IV family protein [Gammaproteobacteria bacterium]|nr:cytochrome C oxidase subunit IV family protein [Gammaproteobacteria bacterium]